MIRVMSNFFAKIQTHIHTTKSNYVPLPVHQLILVVLQWSRHFEIPDEMNDSYEIWAVTRRGKKGHLLKPFNLI